MSRLKLLITLLIGWSSVLEMANGKIVRCNYDPLPTYRYSEKNFKPSDIDPNLCTHLIYLMEFSITPLGEFLVVNKTVDFDRGSVEGYLSRTLKLKDSNPKLKIIAGVYFRINGYNTYQLMSVNAKLRKNFIKTALNFTQTHHFDGLELKWDFSYQWESTEEEKMNFVKVLQELNTELKPLNLELSIAVNGTTKADRTSYHLPTIAKYVDYINIMAYGYDSLEPTKFVHNAPIHGPDIRNVGTVFYDLLRAGTPAKKVVLGIPFTGVFYAVSDKNAESVVGATIDYKVPGLGYNKICKAEGKWNAYYDKFSKAQIIYKKNEYVSYDNDVAVKEKVNYGVCIKLAGFMVSNIENDDFRGICREKYLLLKTINDNLNNSVSIVWLNTSGILCNLPYFGV